MSSSDTPTRGDTRVRTGQFDAELRTNVASCYSQGLRDDALTMAYLRTLGLFDERAGRVLQLGLCDHTQGPLPLLTGVCGCDAVLTAKRLRPTGAEVEVCDE